jgi:probable phosphomutase (TIGR03848 family)
MPSADVPAPTLLLLVRHGLTPTTGSLLPGRAPGLYLSDEGRRQAETAAKRIAALPEVAALYASPLERAWETATIIGTARGLPVQAEPDLIELNVGEWTGRKLEDVAKLPEWRTVQSYPSGFRFGDGESFVEMQARMTGALARLVARHPGATVVAVSHADPIKGAVAHALGTPLDLFQRIVIATASVTAIAYGVSGPVVLTVNSLDGDLGGLLPPRPQPDEAQPNEAKP